MIKLLYFSRVREQIGHGGEELQLASPTTTVHELLELLRTRGTPYREALNGSHLRVAVNQVYSRPEDPVPEGAEVAIFPPVSGG